VATAIGLMVAIPAVVAFNFFQSKVRKTLARVDAVAHVILSTFSSGTGESDAAEPAVRAEMKG
jgi:biopolymer transport protein ExbB